MFATKAVPLSKIFAEVVQFDLVVLEVMQQLIVALTDRGFRSVVRIVPKQRIAF